MNETFQKYKKNEREKEERRSAVFFFINFV